MVHLPFCLPNLSLVLLLQFLSQLFFRHVNPSTHKSHELVQKMAVSNCNLLTLQKQFARCDEFVWKPLFVIPSSAHVAHIQTVSKYFFTFFLRHDFTQSLDVLLQSAIFRKQ